MAELVDLRLEYSLPELEEMERIGLFTSQEIKKIIKNRKSFEYRLRRRLKQKDDFLKYIEYEMNLLTLIQKRRDRLLIEVKKAEIDNSVAKRINRLYKSALSRFSEDEQLWLDQISFCKKMRWYDTISGLFTRLLQVHSRNPSLWILAAQWEMEESRAPENARKIMQRGILLNPESSILFREYFRMEMMYVDLIRKRKAVLESQKVESMSTDENDAVLSGKIANVVYDKASETFNDVEYSLSFIQICLDFDFGERHVEYILKDVQERFPDKEETLDALAKKPLLYLEEKLQIAKQSGARKSETLEKINNEIFGKYENAVEGYSTEKMWTFYLDYVVSLMNSAKQSRRDRLEKAFVELLERASTVNCLSSKYLLQWVQLNTKFEYGN